MKNGVFTEEEKKKIKENQLEEKRFRRELAKLLSGDEKVASKPLLIGVTPNAIDCCIDKKGIELVIFKSVIKKCMKNEKRDEYGRQTKKSGHGLTEQQINDIVWAIKRPVMIIKGSHQDSLAVMTDIRDDEGRYVFVFISLGKEGITAKVNVISSAYGRNNLHEYLERSFQNDMVLAINTEKVDEVCLSIGGHFSKATTPINFDNTIAYSLKSVKKAEL